MLSRMESVKSTALSTSPRDSKTGEAMVLVGYRLLDKDCRSPAHFSTCRVESLAHLPYLAPVSKPLAAQSRPVIDTSSIRPPLPSPAPAPAPKEEPVALVAARADPLPTPLPQTRSRSSSSSSSTSSEEEPAPTPIKVEPATVVASPPQPDQPPPRQVLSRASSSSSSTSEDEPEPKDEPQAVVAPPPQSAQPDPHQPSVLSRASSSSSSSSSEEEPTPTPITADPPTMNDKTHSKSVEELVDEFVHIAQPGSDSDSSVDEDDDEPFTPPASEEGKAPRIADPPQQNGKGHLHNDLSSSESIEDSSDDEADSLASTSATPLKKEPSSEASIVKATPTKKGDSSSDSDSDSEPATEEPEETPISTPMKLPEFDLPSSEFNSPSDDSLPPREHARNKDYRKSTSFEDLQGLLSQVIEATKSASDSDQEERHHEESAELESLRNALRADKPLDVEAESARSKLSARKLLEDLDQEEKQEKKQGKTQEKKQEDLPPPLTDSSSPSKSGLHIPDLVDSLKSLKVSHEVPPMASSPAKSSSKKDKSAAQSPTEVVAPFLKFSNLRDRWNELVADDFYYQVHQGPRLEGRDFREQVLERVFASFPDFRYTLEDEPKVQEGHAFLTTFSYGVGFFSGAPFALFNFAPIAATNQTVLTQREVNILNISNGKLQYWLHFPSDSSEVLAGLVGIYLAAGGNVKSTSVQSSTLSAKPFLSHRLSTPSLDEIEPSGSPSDDTDKVKDISVRDKLGKKEKSKEEKKKGGSSKEATSPRKSPKEAKSRSPRDSTSTPSSPAKSKEERQKIQKSISTIQKGKTTARSVIITRTERDDNDAPKDKMERIFSSDSYLNGQATPDSPGSVASPKSDGGGVRKSTSKKRHHNKEVRSSKKLEGDEKDALRVAQSSPALAEESTPSKSSSKRHTKVTSSPSSSRLTDKERSGSPSPRKQRPISPRSDKASPRKEKETPKEKESQKEKEPASTPSEGTPVEKSRSKGSSKSPRRPDSSVKSSEAKKEGEQGSKKSDEFKRKKSASKGEGESDKKLKEGDKDSEKVALRKSKSKKDEGGEVRHSSSSRKGK